MKISVITTCYNREKTIASDISRSEVHFENEQKSILIK